jgi:hypothetical protein
LHLPSNLLRSNALSRADQDSKKHNNGEKPFETQRWLMLLHERAEVARRD